MFDISTLAYNIRRYRKNCGFTQQQLASALSISPQSVSKWECGAAAPDLEKLCMLTELLHVSAEQLLGMQSGEETMIAIDGGGTKTEFVLFDQSGRVLSRIKKEGCNPNVCGIEAAIEVIRSGINRLVAESPNVIGIYAGCAGFASGDHKKIMTRELRRLYPNLKIKCETDIANVISATTDEENCIAAICGTGVVVYANTSGDLHRIGGWGYLLDEGGSGFTIGRDALRAALADRDGLGEHTVITELAENMIGSDVWSHIGDIYKGGNSYIASFAPVVTAAYSMGDAVACEILEKNAAELAKCILSAARNYRCGRTVVMAGSVIVKDDLYRKLVEEKIGGSLRLIVSKMPAVYGACVECCKLCSVPTSTLHENFIDSYAVYSKN